MCGMNADRVAQTASDKAKRATPGHEGLGTVIINLQQTQMDSVAALRIFAPLDTVLVMLSEELGYTGPYEGSEAGSSHYVLPAEMPGRTDKEDVFVIPYDAEGKLSQSCRTRLDLREGAVLRITGHTHIYMPIHIYIYTYTNFTCHTST